SDVAIDEGIIEQPYFVGSNEIAGNGTAIEHDVVLTGSNVPGYLHPIQGNGAAIAADVSRDRTTGESNESLGRDDIAAKVRVIGNHFPSAHLAADAACPQRHLPTGSQCASDDGSIDRGNVLRGVDTAHTSAVEAHRPMVVAQTPADRRTIMRRYTAATVEVGTDRAVGQSDCAVDRFDRALNGGVARRARTAVGADGTVDGIGSGRLHRAVLGSQRDVLVAGTDGIARQREPTVRNDGDMAEPAGIDLQRVTGRQVHGAVACEGV